MDQSYDATTTDQVTIGVATFGDASWVALANERAIPSARAQGARVIHCHRATLSEARNAVLDATATELLVNLDADDELEAGYIDTLLAGSADLRVPSVRYVAEGRRPQEPRVPRVAGHDHDCSAACLPQGNFMVIGTLARAQLLRDAGGWEEFPWSEDWAMWSRCWKAGATIETIPEAVYRAHVRWDSRNRAPDRAAKNAAHEQIHRAVWPEQYQDTAA